MGERSLPGEHITLLPLLPEYTEGAEGKAHIADVSATTMEKLLEVRETVFLSHTCTPQA